MSLCEQPCDKEIWLIAALVRLYFMDNVSEKFAARGRKKYLWEVLFYVVEEITGGHCDVPVIYFVCERTKRRRKLIDSWFVNDWGQKILTKCL